MNNLAQSPTSYDQNEIIRVAKLTNVDDVGRDQLEIISATRDQSTIPKGVSDRLLNASIGRTNIILNNRNIDTKSATDETDSENKDILSLNNTSRGMKAGTIRSIRQVRDSKKRMSDIARRIATTQEIKAGSAEKMPAVSERIAARLKELEVLSKDLNKEISHVDAIVAIKESYLHEIKTANELLTRANLDENGDEALRAAAMIILSKVPKRYNPEAKNREDGETIGQVIARLEEEVERLQTDIDANKMEVNIEITLLNALSEKKLSDRLRYLIGKEDILELKALFSKIINDIIDARFGNHALNDTTIQARLATMRDLAKTVVNKTIAILPFDHNAKEPPANIPLQEDKPIVPQKIERESLMETTTFFDPNTFDINI